MNHQKLKVSIIMTVLGLALTGCGSSSEEDQLAWMYQWDNNPDAKIKVVYSCFKDLGIKNFNKLLTDQQNTNMNICEVNKIMEIAAKDGITLDREFVEDNSLQL